AGLVGLETHQPPLPPECAASMPAKMLEMLATLVTEATVGTGEAFTVSQLAELQKAVGMKPHESGKTDYANSLSALIDAKWGQLDSKEQTDKVEQLKSRGRRHDVDLNEEQIKGLTNARAAMIEPAFKKIGRIDSDETSNLIDMMLDWASKLTPVLPNGDNKKLFSKQGSIYKTTKVAMTALTEFKKLGDVHKCTEDDKDMAKSQRLLRPAESLSKRIEQVKGCGFDWSEDRLIENLGEGLTQLVPESGSKRVELLRSSQTTKQIGYIFMEYMPEYKGAHEVNRAEIITECQMTVAARHITRAITTVNDKVLLRTTIRDVAQTYMMNRELKVAAPPTIMRNAISQGLKQQRIIG
ncbi:unnamed protein product, partial [Prorocentrum cordatum]